MYARLAKWVVLAMVSTAPLTAEQTINMLDLDPSLLEDFWAGNYPNKTIEVPAGTEVVLNLNISGDLISLTIPENQTVLKVLKSYFIRCVQDEEGETDFLFSFDQKNWGDLDELTTGNINASLKIENGRPIISLGIEVNQIQNN